LTIAGEGTYTVDTATGIVTFDPLPTFTGAASTVNYQVSDSRGEIAFSTINVTVGPPPAPTASPDSFSDAYDTNHTYSPLVNDTVLAASFPFVPSTLRLCAVGTTTGCNLTTLTVPGEGTYSVDTSSGEVVFNPVATFVGTATPVHYEVKDSLDRTVGSTITPTVGPPPAPTAVPDALSDAYDTNHSYTPIANDTVPASSFPLLANTVRLCAEGTTTNCNLTTLTIANQGTYTVNTTTGVVTFDPLPTFIGTATPVNYEAKDSLNRVVGSTITPTVGPPPGPTASPNVSSGGYDQNQTISPVVNDAAGAAAFPLVLTSVKLCDPSSTPPQSSPNCTLTTLTIAGEGTYTVNTTTGVVTFDPLPTFTGAASTVNYQVSDSRGEIAFSTINVTVTPPIAPQATDDYSTDVVNLTQVFPITSNDVAAPSLTIVTSSALLCGTGEVPFNCSKTNVTISGEGTYTLDSTGEVTFVPVTDYIGNATPITYMVNDSFGQTASAQIFVVVTPTPVPLAVDDSSSDQMNRTQTLNLLTNDSSPAGHPLTPSSVRLCGLDPLETAPTCSQTVVAIAGQGRLEVLNGVVTFTPETGFVGQVDEVGYVVSNSFGEKASAIIRITVTPQVIVASTPPPTIQPESPVVVVPPPESWPDARPDRKAGPLNKMITVSAWLNDLRADADFDPQSIRFCSGACSLDAAEASYMMEHTVTEGVWSLDPNSGLISFMPALDWHGTVSINYAIWDLDGKMAHSKVTVVIEAPVNQPVLADTGFAGGQFLASIFLIALGFGLLRRNVRLSNQQSF
jgi:CshA-type fibril repeat protein